MNFPFTIENEDRELGVVVKSTDVRDRWNNLISFEKLSEKFSTNSKIHFRLDRFAHICHNVVLFQPVTGLEYLPTFGLGAD